ncbi:MAG: ABC transporter permease subunit [Oscillospiraceae bacterium]|nr:ABC transporter permease subunit [Oscillospiraceae bacterium]
MKKTTAKSKRGKYLYYYLFMLPGLLYLLINNYIPMIGIFIAFKKLNYTTGIFASDWVGFDNFQYLFRTRDAFIITRNTVLYNLVFIFLYTILGIIIAIFLSEMRRKRLARLYQSVLLLPNLVSMVIVSYLAFAFLSSENGLLNNAILPMLGMAEISWYGTPGPWPVILTIVSCWCYTGVEVIIYMSVIVGIDRSLYESAEIDGAGKWRQITSITLPMLKPTIIILQLMFIGRIFHSDFGLFYLIPMNSGMLYNVTSTLDTYVYTSLVRLQNIPMASAAGLYQSFVGFVLVICANLAVRKLEPDSALF